MFAFWHAFPLKVSESLSHPYLPICRRVWQASNGRRVKPVCPLCQENHLPMKEGMVPPVSARLHMSQDDSFQGEGVIPHFYLGNLFLLSLLLPACSLSKGSDGVS